MRARSVRRGDRGAVLLIVAVFAIVAVIMLAFVVDIGGLREQRKDVTLSTDAAALAAAGEASLDLVPAGTYDCELIPTGKLGVSVGDVARLYLEKNDREVPLDFPCEVVVTGKGRGFVAVGAKEDVDFAFGSAIGQPQGRVEGASIAAISDDPGGGLRPIGVCNAEESLNKVLGESLNVQDDILDAAKVADDEGNLTKLVLPVDIVLEKEHLKKTKHACGTKEASGQRGQLNFDGGGNADGGKCDKSPTPDSYSDHVGNGYYGEVDEFVAPDPGENFNSVEPCLTELVQTGKRFWVPVYDDFKKENSDQAYRVKHFLEVELAGYCLNKGYAEEPSGQTDCELILEEGPPEVSSEWYRFIVYRVVTPDSFPTVPPRTSDAESLPPAICGEEDTPAARTACG